MNDLIVGDTIQCTNAQDAADCIKELEKAGYIWDCFKDIMIEKYIITILGRRLPDGES